MARLELLSKSQQIKFDSCPKLKKGQMGDYFSLNDDIQDYLSDMRKPINKVGFLIQLAYFRASGKFFTNNQFNEQAISFACHLLDLNSQSIDFSENSYNANARQSHKEYILKYCDWKKFTEYQSIKLSKELHKHAQHQKYPKHLFSIAIEYLIEKKIELPPYYVLCDIIGNVYNKIEDHLVSLVEKFLSPNQKRVLDDLIWFDNKSSKHYKYSALAELKQMSHSTKLPDILNSVKTYKLLKAFYHEFINVYSSLELSEQAIIYYSRWVQKSRLFQLKQFVNRSKAYLYLLAHIKHQYFSHSDLYVDVFIKAVRSSLNIANKKEEEFKTVLLRQQKNAIKKLISLHGNSKEVFLNLLQIFSIENLDSNKKIENAQRIIVAHLKNDKTVEVDSLDVMKLFLSDEVLRSNKLDILSSMGARLQRKLSPILCLLDFEYGYSTKKIKAAVSNFSDTNGKILNNQTSLFLSSQEKELIQTGRKLNALVYKALLFSKVSQGILAGSINLECSFRYLSMEKYLIDDKKWSDSKREMIESSGLSRFSDFSSVKDILNEILNEKFSQTNEDYANRSNKHLKIAKSGRFIISTPKAKDKQENLLSTIFCKEGIIPVPNILEKIDSIIDFSASFRHHAVKKVIMKPTPKLIHAGLLSKGCNHGLLKMVNISKGITSDKLKNTVNWFFSLENIQAANNVIIEYINKLSLPNIYKIDPHLTHSSSDGQKFNVGVNSIHANYFFKYFGKEQGISVYTFIDDKQVLFYDTAISPTEREAAYVLDGLMSNNILKNHIHSTDTYGFSEAIFATTHLIGVSFAPRIKKIAHQRLYCIDSLKKYQGDKFKIKPSNKINIKLIESSWDDILRFIATIKTRKTAASKIFKRLNSYTKEHPLYKALKGFGRIIKTIFILTYIDNLLLRQQIEKQLNKIELSNKFGKAVFFANGQEFRIGSNEEQRIIVACRSLIQNCIVLWNYLYLSQALVDKDTLQERNKLCNHSV
jgi:TnpA family transposase